MIPVHVLRIGHRPERDKRITTHVCLTARAFGADGIIISGLRDPRVIESVERVVGKWGGRFFIRFDDWKSAVKRYRKEGWYVVHLTMYGEEFLKGMTEIKREVKEGYKGLLVVVGSEKVPIEMYELANYNLSVGFQPHSEVAALAVFLEHAVGPSFDKVFENSKIDVPHSRFGKTKKDIN
ncbi:tRNA (cytidine(56)-2'-O)-methyltransferase [Candidatus Micrarchaeota archaeon]|nr:tRNA (cytidine(56)-2'-O)-methyltransferase [Candidatus Micrarchaeota archaeon]